MLSPGHKCQQSVHSLAEDAKACRALFLPSLVFTVTGGVATRYEAPHRMQAVTPKNALHTLSH